MSGSDEADFRRQIQTGATVFLQKAFVPDEMLAAVDAALQERR